jgi:TrmH family RNA methyltransferase
MENLKPLKWYRDLDTAQGRLEAAAFLVEGSRAVTQIIDGSSDQIIEILLTEDLAARYSRFPLRILTEKQLNSLSSVKTPQGILVVVRLPEGVYSEKIPQKTGTKLLILEDIQDPGNTGTLIRTAAAFDFSGVIMTEKCADPFSPKCVQATAGSILSLWIRRTKNYLPLIQAWQKEGYKLIAADLNGAENPETLHSFPKIMLALGNEASGLSPSLLNISDCKIRIPLNSKKVQSLNVAACGAICMFLTR